MATPRKKKAPELPKKQCQGECKKIKQLNKFYKVNSPMFPDGRINICNECVRKTVDVEDLDSVISFLRSIDKPFIQKSWDKAVSSGRYPLGEYVRKVNSLQQVSDKNFDNSDVKRSDEISVSALDDSIETDNGEVIHFDESLVSKWGTGFKKHEYLRLEKFYQDMCDTHEVVIANHKQMLKQLAKLSIEMDNLLESKEYTNYEKVSKTYKMLEDSAGFTPKNRKNGAEATGLMSFSQTWAEIEKEGFVPPKLVEFERDDIDYMLLYYMQFTQRLVGKEVSIKPPKNWRDEIIYAEDEEIDLAELLERHEDEVIEDGK